MYSENAFTFSFFRLFKSHSFSVHSSLSLSREKRKSKRKSDVSSGFFIFNNERTSCSLFSKESSLFWRTSKILSLRSIISSSHSFFPENSRTAPSFCPIISSAAASQQSPRPLSILPGSSLWNLGCSRQISQRLFSPREIIMSQRFFSFRNGHLSFSPKIKWGEKSQAMFAFSRFPNVN